MQLSLIYALLGSTFILAFAEFSGEKAGCHKYMNNAEIVGIDNRMIPCLGSDTCNCPGGIYITIDNVTALNGHSFKAKLYPHNFKYTAPFPIAVKIDWEYDTIPCGGNRIDILKIAKR